MKMPLVTTSLAPSGHLRPLGLTEKQAAVLDWLRDWFADHEAGPTYREIMRGTGMRSASAAVRLVRGLRERGYVDFQERRGRSIRLVEPEDRRREAELAEARRALLTLTKAADAAVAYLPEAAPARRRLALARDKCALAVDRARAAIPFAGPPARVPLPHTREDKTKTHGSPGTPA